jgi:hypothetical protein
MMRSKFLGIPMRIAFMDALMLVSVVRTYAVVKVVSASIGDSDIIIQWMVCQYVNSGVNPYPLARDVLIAKYGAGNPGRAKIFGIPKEVPVELAAEISPQLGPPEATYPPPAVGLLALTVGLLPKPGMALWVWFAVNLAAAVGVAIGLTRLWPVPPRGGTASDNLLYVLAALLLFSATYRVMAVGQFSLLVLCLLLAANDPSLPWLLRGVALGVALLKPSVALPFVLLPLVRREWRVLLAAASVQAVGTLYVAAQTGGSAGLFLDWLTVSRFFLQGIYTLQDWLNAVSPRMPWLVAVAPLGVLGLCGIILAVARELPDSRLFNVAAITSVFWMYHSGADFVGLLPILMPLAGWSDRQPRRPWSAIGLVLFAVLSLALTETVARSDDPATWAMRWVARISVIGLLLREYVQVYLSARRHQVRSV